MGKSDVARNESTFFQTVMSCHLAEVALERASETMRAATRVRLEHNVRSEMKLSVERSKR